MTSCHRSSTRIKKDSKEDEKGEKKRKVIQFTVNTPMLANWVPI
jgi:hypothetical protein